MIMNVHSHVDEDDEEYCEKCYIKEKKVKTVEQWLEEERNANQATMILDIVTHELGEIEKGLNDDEPLGPDPSYDHDMYVRARNLKDRMDVVHEQLELEPEDEPDYCFTFIKRVMNLRDRIMYYKEKYEDRIAEPISVEEQIGDNLDLVYRELKWIEKGIYDYEPDYIKGHPGAHTVNTHERINNLKFRLWAVHQKLGLPHEDECDSPLPPVKITETMREHALQLRDKYRESVTCKIVAQVEEEEDVQQTATFVNDTEKTTTDIGVVSPELTDFVESRKHTIEDILSRPVIIGQGEWTDTTSVIPRVNILPSDSPTDLPWELERFRLPQALPAAAQNILDKINYFAYVRADVRVRVVLNTTPFQAGRAILTYHPYVPETGGERFNLTHNYQGLTGFPHIELDVNQQNVGEMIIPYVHPAEAFMVSAVQRAGANPIGQNVMGEIRLSVLNGLETGSVPYTVYANFENVQVMIPTPAQTNNNTTAIQELQKALDDANRTIAQYKIVRPMPVAQVDEQAHPFSNTPARAFTHANSNTRSVDLSLLDSSIGDSTEAFSKNEDEMDISTICKRSAMIDRFSWTTTNVPGDVLNTVRLTPSPQAADETHPDGITRWMTTPMQFVSTMFDFWRGGIKMRFSAIKTGFHSGRLRIMFVPYVSLRQNVLDPKADRTQAYVWYWDVKHSSELEIKIPFVSSLPWLTTDLSTDSGFPFIMGSLEITVVNSLVAPGTVSPTIEINSWMSSDDMEFTKLRIKAAVTDSTLPPPPPLVKRSAKSLPVAQVSEEDSDYGHGGVYDNFGGKAVMDTLGKCSDVAGKPVKSLKDVITRMAFMRAVDKESPAIRFGITPRYFGVVQDPTEPTFSNPIHYVSWMYRFHRGGRRYLAYVPNQSSTITANLKEAQDDILADYVAVPLSEEIDIDRNGSSSHIVHTSKNPFLEVTIPYFCNAKCVPIMQTVPFVYAPVFEITVRNHDGTDLGGSFLATGAAPDFRFGFAVGTPFVTATVRVV